MITQPYHLYVERIAPERNMERFYALAVQPTLFGEVSLVRAWGRIGTRGQQMEHLLPGHQPVPRRASREAQTGLSAKTTCGHPTDLILVSIVADDNPVIS
jgi:predicted DNA-binding WGR domain protein